MAHSSLYIAGILMHATTLTALLFQVNIHFFHYQPSQYQIHWELVTN